MPPALAAEARACSAAGWALFLGVERCALPLSRVLPSDPLSPAAAGILPARALAELQRVLAARAQLLTLAAAAAERGWTAVVLKGGAGVAAGDPPLDLVDVDVLVPRRLAAEVAGYLDGSGYDRQGRDRDVESSSFWHLAARHAPGSILVEVHFTVPGLEPVDQAIARAVPLPGRPLLRLAPADELWHLLAHGVTQHLYRRGNLRELRLVRAALSRCSAEDRREVDARTRAHPDGAVMQAVLRMAEWPEGTAPADPFTSMAAGNYLAGGGRTPFRSSVLRADCAMALSALLARGGAARRLWGAVAAPADLESLHPAIAVLERGAPPLGRAARVLQRVARLSASFAWALPMAARARRLARTPALPR